MENMSPMLYVHVPFCRKKCRYCAFFSEAVAREAALPEGDYLDTLFAEMAMRTAEPLEETPAESDSFSAPEGKGGVSPSPAFPPPISTVFIGGGTPSLLSSSGLVRLFAQIRRHYRLAYDAEITLEGNPESLADADKLRALRECGVNRLSIGVQSMCDAELLALGRVHGRNDVIRAFSLARQAGFANIGMDLIWGLPGQTPDTWRKTLADILALEPEHISAYGLTVEPGTPLAFDVAGGEVLLPSDETQARLYEAGAGFLEVHGYRQYEISNFCRPGFACRHNMGYWAGVDYHGLGPAAVSTEKGLRRTNPANIKAWTRLVRSGRRPQAEILTPDIRAEEYVMLRLRTAEGLDLEACRRQTGYDVGERQASFLRSLCAAGLAEREGKTFRLTRRGMLVSNSIISALFADR